MRSTDCTVLTTFASIHAVPVLTDYYLAAKSFELRSQPLRANDAQEPAIVPTGLKRSVASSSCTPYKTVSADTAS